MRLFSFSCTIVLFTIIKNCNDFKFSLYDILDKSGISLYQLKKVDTEKIFQLNNFSKVDNMSFPDLG